MNTGKQLGKIDSHLHAFTLTEEVEHLLAAQYLIADLVTEIRIKEGKECIKNFNDKLNLLLKK